MAEKETLQRDPFIVRSAEDDRLPLTDPDRHHHISKTQRYPINVMKWMKENEHDMAVKVSQSKFIVVPTKNIIQDFLPKLSDHLLQRLLPDGEEITNDDRSRLIIQNNQIYCQDFASWSSDNTMTSE